VFGVASYSGQGIYNVFVEGMIFFVGTGIKGLDIVDGRNAITFIVEKLDNVERSFVTRGKT
jgi:hypothetical protein